MTSSSDDAARSKIRRKPNPLFEQWIYEWMNEATEKNLEVRHGYRHALGSLQKYPLTLKSGKECLILKFFGPKLCAKLDKRLEDYNRLSSNTIDERVTVDDVSKNIQFSSACVQNKSPVISLIDEDLSTCNAVTNDTGKEKIVLWPNEFTVILLIDTGESSSLRKTNLDKVISELSSLNVTFEMRRLSVGDFVWICRDRNGRELMLPYILERKRLDDLSGSIQDGRFHEQKFRLKNCRLDNKIYLVENEKKYHGLPVSHLEQALANTEVIDGFTVVRTENHLESMRYIANFSNLLTDMYKDKTLTTYIDEVDSGYVDSSNTVKLISFKTFSTGSSKNKNMTVRDMLIRQLIQIRGLSVHKAFAIVKHYPCPKILINAFKRSRNPLLLANISYGTPVKTVGPTISKTLFQIYSNCNRA